MQSLIAYIVTEEVPHDYACAPIMFKILKEIYEKDKNIAVFTEYLSDQPIKEMYQGKYEKSWLPLLKPFCEFCQANKIPILSIVPDDRYYFISNDYWSVHMFRKFLRGYYENFYGRGDKNFVFFMGKPHGAYFEELLKEMGYEVITYEITLVDKGQVTPPFPYNYQNKED